MTSAGRGVRAIGIRPGEGRTVALVAGLFAALEVGRGFGEIGVDTLVVSRFGAGSLPYLFVGLGTIGLTASLAYGAALGRLERIPLLAGILGGAAVLLLVERLLMTTGLEATVLLTWLTVYAVGAIAVTIVWTMAGSVFDARQARRLFPLCTGAAIAGSFVGTLSSGLVAHAFGTETLVVLEAMMLAVVGGLVVAIARTTTVRVPPRRRDRSIVGDLRVGFDTVIRSPLMRLVAVAYVLLSILMFSVTYPFLLAASETFKTEADLATALGVLSATVTATSFVVSVVLANRAYARFGVTGAALLLPIVYLGGFGLWLVAFSFSTAALFRFTQQVTQRGLSNSAWSAFYNVIPRERRAQVLAFNDGVPGQVGTILSGLLLLAAGSLFARDQVFLLGLITAIVCTVVVLGVRRRYRASVVDSLRSGLAEQVLEGGPGIEALARDPAVSDTLITALSAPERGVRRMAASLLSGAAIERAGPALVRVVDDDPDPTVRVAALESLGALGGPPPAMAATMACLLDDDERIRATALRTLAGLGAAAQTIDTDPWIASMAEDPSPTVRAALACLYGSHGPDPRSVAIVVGLLADPDQPEQLAGLDAARRLGDTVPVGAVRGLLDDPAPTVRVAALLALAARGTSDDTDAHDAVVRNFIASLDDDASDVRATAAAALSERETTPPGLLDVLDHGSSRAQEAALAALRGHGPDVRPEIIAWTLAGLERAADLHRARIVLTTTEPAVPALAFLLSVLASRESHTVGLALRALVVLGVPEADGVIRRCLHSNDPEVRAQAIEAIDSIGDSELPAALVRLLEDEPAGVRDGDAELARLADDDDPWISGLARRLRVGENEMPDTTRTLGDLDTMLFLRRVPLFESLEPEDLQRIAAAAVEHLYPAGETMVHEGEVGDELIVIVEGSVRVVHVNADGTERLIHRYEAGDHIGELAVLREAPRAATVIAGDAGVRGLVIGGAGLTSILRERPDAAMAMLAVLAERISRQ
jgi:HEAT repeat protein/ATP/ADP translocase